MEGWHIKPAGSVLPWIPVQSCVGRPSEYRTCFKTKRAFEMASLLGELVSYRDPPVCSGWLACVHFPSLLWPTCVGSEPKSGSQGSAVLTLRRPWLLDRTWVVGRSNIRLRSVAKLPCRNPFVFGGGVEGRVAVERCSIGYGWRQWSHRIKPNLGCLSWISPLGFPFEPPLEPFFFLFAFRVSIVRSFLLPSEKPFPTQDLLISPILQGSVSTDPRNE